MVSARWVCSRTPLSRARTAASLSSVSVTENGEHGATPIRSIESGEASWNRSTASVVAARMVSRSSTTWSGGRPALRPAEVHRAAGRHEPQPDRSGAVDLGGEQVAAVGREDVVVVHRRRAPGLREPAEPAGRGGRHRLLVDAAPHRVERGQPLEEGRVDGEAAGDPLVQVVVGVDQPRRDDAAAGVDDARALDVRRRPGADRGHPAVLDDDVAVGILAAVAVHRHDRAAGDDHALGHVRPRSPGAARRSRRAAGPSRRARCRRRCRAGARARRGSRPPSGRPPG